MNKIFLIIVIIYSSFGLASAQYKFTVDTEVKRTAIKNQQNTGTFWSIATCSFLESELLNVDQSDNDLSEMFVVRNIYRDKAMNYVLRQGKANFSQGSLSHDFINTVARHGIVPENVFSGKLITDTKHDHDELSAVLKGMLDAIRKQKRPSEKWMDAFDAVLDVYLGKVDEHFTVDGKDYTPKTYAMSLGLSPDNYLSITSFTHHPFYKTFILEIPDNYSNQSYYNIPFEELEQIVDDAIEMGYSIAWDGDVSEKGFSAKNGIAILPIDSKREDLFEQPGLEMAFSVDKRQRAFESYSTTDDHLMHIVGTAHDQAGNKYFKIKILGESVANLEVTYICLKPTLG